MLQHLICLVKKKQLGYLLGYFYFLKCLYIEVTCPDLCALFFAPPGAGRGWGVGGGWGLGARWIWQQEHLRTFPLGRSAEVLEPEGRACGMGGGPQSGAPSSRWKDVRVWKGICTGESAHITSPSSPSPWRSR